MAEAYAFGIDVGGTTVKNGLFSREGELLESWEIRTRTQDNGVNILPDIAETIRGKMEERGLHTEQIIGIGVGVPGPVIKESIVNVAVNLHWGVINVADELSKALDGIPVKVANDANIAALGEQWKGGGRGCQDMVMVTLGTGVGGGLIIDGRIHAGANGAAGEIGHIQVDKKETAVCNCGKTGCLEQFCSATGIVRMARKALAENKVPTVLEDNDALTTKVIFDAAKAGDAVALGQVEAMGERLGDALAAIAAVVDPQAVVVGGGVSKAGTIVTDAIARHYASAAFHACRNVVFKLAELGNDAGMYGAARMILQ